MAVGGTALRVEHIDQRLGMLVFKGHIVLDTVPNQDDQGRCPVCLVGTHIASVLNSCWCVIWPASGSEQAVRTLSNSRLRLIAGRCVQPYCRRDSVLIAELHMLQ